MCYVSGSKQHVTLFDIMHDVGSGFKGSAAFACVSSFTTHVRIDDGVAAGGGEDEEGETGEIKTSPAKITGVTEEKVVIRIDGTRRMLFCDPTQLEALEDLVPFNAEVTYQGAYLLSFTPDNAGNGTAD